MLELLSALQEQDSEPERLREAWSRCVAVGEGLGDALSSASSAPDSDAELREALERVVRLNAILRQAVVAQQDRLAASLTSTRDSGAQLRGYAPAEPTAGGACDMAG